MASDTALWYQISDRAEPLKLTRWGAWAVSPSLTGYWKLSREMRL
jgi:hypothetical protein